MKCIRWVILDNIKHRWEYSTNLNSAIAGAEYLWLVNNEYIRDGLVTDLGNQFYVEFLRQRISECE